MIKFTQRKKNQSKNERIKYLEHHLSYFLLENGAVDFDRIHENLLVSSDIIVEELQNHIVSELSDLSYIFYITENLKDDFRYCYEYYETVDYFKEKTIKPALKLLPKELRKDFKKLGKVFYKLLYQNLVFKHDDEKNEIDWELIDEKLDDFEKLMCQNENIKETLIFLAQIDGLVNCIDKIYSPNMYWDYVESYFGAIPTGVVFGHYYTLETFLHGVFSYYKAKDMPNLIRRDEILRQSCLSFGVQLNYYKELRELAYEYLELKNLCTKNEIENMEFFEKCISHC